MVRSHVLRRRLRSKWQKRPFRVVVTLVGLLILVALDAYLIVPLFDPRIDGQAPYTENVYAGEELLLTGLLPTESRLALDAADGVDVAFWSSQAHLSAELRNDWSGLGLELAADPLSVTYTFGQAASGPDATPCQTMLLLTPVSASGSPMTLRLDQQATNVSQSMVPLRLTPIGADLRVQADDHGDPGVSCRRLLRIDDNEIYDPRQLVVTLPAGQSLELAFSTADGVVEPFGSGPLLQAQTLEIRSKTAAALQVDSSGAATPSIRIAKLRGTIEHLEVTYSGQGVARGARAPAGTKPFARFQQGLLAYPLWVLFLSMVHLALFNWFRVSLFDRQARHR